MTELEVYAVDRPVPIDTSTERVRVLVAAWLLSFTSEHTQRAYARDVTMWLDWCAASSIEPLEARRVHIDAWRQAGAGFTVEHPADTSMHRRLSAVSSWYGYLVVEEVTERNPAAHVRRPKIDRDYSSTRGLTRDEARAIDRADLGPRLKALVKLLMYDGLREAEVILADVDDLGLDRGHRVLDVTRKGGKVQRIPLAPTTCDALDAYLDGRTTGPLMVTSTGARMHPSQVYRDVRRTARLAGIERPEEVSPHSLRHAFATLALDAGAPLRDVQAAMGHADPRTTERYDRARGQLDRHPTYVLAAYLAGKGDQG